MTTTDTDIADWIYEEYDRRLRIGMTGSGVAIELKALIEECGRVQEAWDAGAIALIHHLYQARLTNERRHVVRVSRDSASAAPAEDSGDTPRPPFGAPILDATRLSEASVVFDTLIYVDPHLRYMRAGNMLREHWERKQRRYALLGGFARTREGACASIAKRIVGDLTTEECLSADEFKRLIYPLVETPDIVESTVSAA